MSGTLLAEGLFNARGEQLRLVYALLVETKLLSMLTAAVKDRWHKDVNHFEEDLQRIVADLAHIPDEQLQVELFLHILELLDIRGAHFNDAATVAYTCEQILQKTYDLQIEQDAAFKTFVQNRTDDKTQQLLKYQMQKIFESFDASLEQMEEAQQLAFIEQLEQFIQTLSPEKQRQLKEKLGVDDITKSTLTKMIATQGSVLLLMIVVEVAGFTAFTTLTSFMAWFAGIFGATLPFGAYIFATSTLAFITGPFALIAAAVGGTLFFNHQNNKIKKRFVPIGIVQLLLVTTIEEQAITDGTPFFNYWTSIYEQQLHAEQTIRENEAALMNKKAERQHLQQQSIDTYIRLTTARTAWQQQLDAARTLYEEVPLHAYTSDALALYEQRNEVTRQLAHTVATKHEKQREKGVWTTLKNTATIMKLNTTIRELEQQYETLTSSLIDTLLAQKPQALHHIATEHDKLSIQIKELQATIDALNNMTTALNKQITEHEQHIRTAKKRRSAHQKNYYGLQHIEGV